MKSLTESLMIYAAKNRDASIFDVPVAYLWANIPKDKTVLVNFEVEFVDIICDVNPSLLDYVIYEHGKKVLWLKSENALYVCTESSILGYNIFTNTIKKMNSNINPYDKCLAHKIVDYKQFTILWYVADKKLYHVDSKVNDNILKKIKCHFGYLSIQWGLNLEFLGMDIMLHPDDSVSIVT